ncbi:hypothetical protein MRB53_038807 [Persea americana]|nr:hypothetical protein MRB53_038807 [Persea americana]
MGTMSKTLDAALQRRAGVTRLTPLSTMMTVGLSPSAQNYLVSDPVPSLSLSQHCNGEQDAKDSSGLMSALALSSTDRRIIILERIAADAFHDQGAGLGLRQEVVDFLDEFKSESVRLPLHKGAVGQVLNKDGSIAGEVPSPNWSSSRWSDIVDLLMQSLGKGCDMRWSCEVVGVETRNARAVVRYVNDHGDEEEISEVDLVVAADGANSTVRRLMGATPERTYAGYVFYRGIVALDKLSAEAAARFQKSFLAANLSHASLIAYRISPTHAMWGCYYNHTEEEVRDVMVDTAGQKHAYTLTSGMRPEVFDKFKTWTKENLPPLLHEAIDASTTATIQVITDCTSPCNSFFDGRAVLVGEAGALIRPHAIAGTLQAAYHALLLRDLADGKIGAQEWSTRTSGISSTLSHMSHEIGNVLLKTEGGSLELLQRTFAIMEKEFVKVHQLRNISEPLNTRL